MRRHAIAFYASSLVLIGLSLTGLVLRLWYLDFWNYAAFVLELKENLFPPYEPFIKGYPIGIPYWPYLALTAKIAGLLNLSSQVSLSAMGILNSVLLTFAVSLFCRRILSSSFVSFYALVSLLVVWGSVPFYSGFFGLDVFPYVVSYPATFTFSVALIGLAEYQRFLLQPRFYRWFIVLAATILAVLAHPITSLVLLVGVCSLTISKHNITVKDLNFLLIILTPSLAAAFMWPPFPIGHVLSTSYRSSSPQWFSMTLFMQNWPLLLGALTFVPRVRRNKRDPLLIMCLFLSLLFAIGYYAEISILGRVFSFMAISIQFSAADWAFRLEKEAEKHALGIAFFCAISLFLFLRFTGLLQQIALHAKTPSKCSYIQEVRDLFSKDDIVMATSEDSACIPSFGPKVIALRNNYSFNPSFMESRRQIVYDFFSGKADLGELSEILCGVGATKILLLNPWTSHIPHFPTQIGSLGKTLYSDEKLLLVDFHCPRAPLSEQDRKI